jgi:tetratricopeptide (TPR) repeat protein
VATTWSLSFQRVEERNPAAAELLRLYAFLSPDTIPEEILIVGASSLGPVLAPVASDTFRRNQAIEALQVYSLAHRNPREKSLSIHRLVQAVLQDEMKEVERQCWAERAVLAVNAAFPHVEHRVWPQCERLLPHALLAIRYIETDYLVSEEAGRLLYETASYFQDHARYSEAELLFQHARDIFEHQVGLEHPQVTSTLHGLADTYRDQEKDTEAEPLYLEALRIIEQQLGETYPDVIYPLHGLAHIYTTREEYELAETFYQRAMTIRELLTTGYNWFILVFGESSDNPN